MLSTVCTSTGVATWSFVIGGSAAFYLGAGQGMLAMFAGALIGQLLVTLATVPASTKHGLETTISTKPQLGTRGVYIGLALLLFTAIGWNTVLMIFFGHSVASVLVLFDIIGPASRDAASTISSAVGLVVIAVMVTQGSRSLSRSGPVIAGCILLLAAWLCYLLLKKFGLDGIMNAEPMEPSDNSQLNYTSVVEMLIGGTFGWWGYMGGMVRMVSSARKTILPTMFGLGLAWAVVASVSLFGALTMGDADPTVWAPKLTGQAGALIVLIFIGLANLGSTLVGLFVSTLAIKQTEGLGRRLSWAATVSLVAAPMLACLVLIPNQIFENVPVFMAYLGMMLGPMVGIQIADWFALGRRTHLSIASLYRPGRQSDYWYLGGFNPAGLIGLVLGSLTYLSILDPMTYVPNSPFFEYTTASLPAVFVGGFSYVVASRVMWRLRPGLGIEQAKARDNSREAPQAGVRATRG